MFEKYLRDKEARLQKKLESIQARANASNDINEVRRLTTEATEIQAELSETRALLADIAKQNETRELPPANATLVNAGAQSYQTARSESEDPTASREYRNAFWAYAARGVQMPAEFRAGTENSTTDTGAAIPITIMNEVINLVRKRYGNLYNKVRKTSVPGGVDVPVGALQATFRWIGEDTVAPREKAGDLGSVSFKYNQCECRIATTFLANLLTLSAFEAAIAEAIAVAYLQAMDTAIVKGSGVKSPLGILNDPRVTSQAGHTIAMTAADLNNWKTWRKNFFSKLPLGYRSGEFIFPLSTVETYLETMSDDNNNPVFRQATGLEVNDGDAVNPNGRFFGREVALVEPDILPDFDTANADDVIGIFWQPEEYMVNENLGFTMIRYFDQETNSWVDKAIAVVDGKVMNPRGFYLITKKNS